MDQKLLDVAKGAAPADLVIKGGKVVNVYTAEIYDGGVAVCNGRIAAVGDVDYCIGEGTEVVDAGGNAEFYKIVGGGHGTGCWNEETLSLISRFLKATL